MKTNTYTLRTIKLIVATLVCIAPAPLWADSEVNVETAGTLSTLLPTSDSKLKITGSINGTDVKYLRQLVTAGTVTDLDISGARIVKGGVAYFEDNKTDNDVIGKAMFKDCTKLKTILLPSNITAILSTAFSGSGLKEIDIPNSVSQLGGDAFAYCSSLAKVVIGNRVNRLEQGVFYSSNVKNAYVKPLSPPSTPAYLFSSNPRICLYRGTERLQGFQLEELRHHRRQARGLLPQRSHPHGHRQRTSTQLLRGHRLHPAQGRIPGHDRRSTHRSPHRSKYARLHSQHGFEDQERQLGGLRERLPHPHLQRLQRRRILEHKDEEHRWLLYGQSHRHLLRVTRSHLCIRGRRRA